MLTSTSVPNGSCGLASSRLPPATTLSVAPAFWTGLVGTPSDRQRDALRGDKRLDAYDLGQIGDGVKSDIEALKHTPCRWGTVRKRCRSRMWEDTSTYTEPNGSRSRSVAMTSQSILEVWLERPDAQGPVRAHWDSPQNAFCSLPEITSRLQGHLTGNVNSIAQLAARFALQEHIDGPSMLRAYDERRRYMTAALNQIPGVTCRMPRGTFYCFPDIGPLLAGPSNPNGPRDSTALAESWLEAPHAAVVPGDAFFGPGHVRFSYSTSLPRIEEGIGRIGRAVEASA